MVVSAEQARVGWTAEDCFWRGENRESSSGLGRERLPPKNFTKLDMVEHLYSHRKEKSLVPQRSQSLKRILEGEDS